MTTTTTKAPPKKPTRISPEIDRTDVSILLTVGALLVIGLVMSLSASSVRSAESTGSAFSEFARQFSSAAVGCAALFAGARFDYRKLKGLSYAAVPVIWVLLVMTLMPGIGIRAGGASRWLPFGPFTVQPSEIAKLVIVVFGADVLSRKMGKLDDWRHIVIPFFLVVGVTCALVLTQPDFGTVVIIASIALVVAFVAGADFKQLAGMTMLAVIVAIPAMLTAGYRRARLMTFLGGASDCLNAAYQTCQGLVALGSGRWFGLGLGSSRQKYLYLPNADTDFVFAILGEETGLIGCLTVLFLFVVLAVLGVRTARRAPDAFGCIIAGGVTGWIALQALINVGAVVGVLPITGVPLPLISFGSTSLLSSLAALGLLASVARRGRPAHRRAE